MDELIDLYGLNSYEFTQTNKEEIFPPLSLSKVFKPSGNFFNKLSNPNS